MTQVCCSQSPCAHGRPLLACSYAGDTQTLKGRCGLASPGPLGPGAHTVVFESSAHLRRAWGLILNAVLPFYHLAGASPLSLDVGYCFLLGSNILLSMLVQQQVAILELVQEKMSTCPSTLPSCKQLEVLVGHLFYM